MPEMCSVFIKRSMTWIWICNFMQQEHICRTCDSYLKKNKIPPQVVCNKLSIQTFPCELKYLNRLESVLISRRMFFKKVTIIPKGCFPKLKCAISNIPVETNDIVNVLPRGADSTGLIFVKLKRKLSFCGHVYLEAVSQEAVQIALVYLK